MVGPGFLNPLVDFMIIGAQKSGTTSLAAQLADHPEVCFSQIKEPGYFNANEDWQSRLDGYHRLFDPEDGQLCGEGSTMYTFLPETPFVCENIHAYNPDMKLIYIMRNPIDRIVSHYAHNLVRSLEKRAPQEAVAEDARYINRSRYGVQIRPYIERFGRDNVLLLVFEEYIADQYTILSEVARFLGISEGGFHQLDDSPRHKTVGVPYLKYESVERFTHTDVFRSLRAIVPEEVRHAVRYRLLSNKLEEVPEFSSALQETIWRLVSDDVAEVEDLLGRDLPAWQMRWAA